jgi:hypothetical protein
MFQRLFKPATIIPLVVFLLARLAASFISLQGNCHAGWTEICWSRWDSGLYLDIAQNGHTLIPCPDFPGAWCGNAGWAPLYPMIIRFFNWLFHLNPALCGIYISAIFFFLYLQVSSRLWEVKSWSARNWIAILICAFAPGSIYFHAVFPISQAVFFMSLVFLFLKKDKFLLAGISAFLGVLSYSIGFFLLPVLAIWALRLWQQNKVIPWEFCTKTILPAILGLLCWFGYDYYSTDHWNALFMVQSKYGHHINSPFKFMPKRFENLVSNLGSLKMWIEIQNFSLVIYVFFSVYFTWKNRNIWNFIFPGIYMIFFWFIPYGASMDVALYRNAALLGPSHSAYSHVPTLYLIGFLLICLVFWYPMGLLFVQSILI